VRTRSILLLTTVLCRSAWGQTYTISTIAGGGLPVNVPGKSASLSGPVGIAADRAGNLFFVDLHTVLRSGAATGTLSLAATAPGLFAQNASGSGPGAILNQDNSLNGPSHAAAKGSVVQVYLSGEGQTNPPSVTGASTTVTLPPPQVTPAPVQPIQVWIGGQQVPYTYAGEAPGMVAGVMQLNVQIPANAPLGALSIQVKIGENMSQNGITVSVQ
jgi:uncharacterized protein (TIGR03437 family)